MKRPDEGVGWDAWGGGEWFTGKLISRSRDL